MIDSLGEITVATPGTPVRATVNRPDPAAKFSCHAMMFQVRPENVGKVYIGRRTLNKATRVGLICILPPPTANVLPTFSASVEMMPNAFNAADYVVDADNSGEGVIGSATVG